MKEFSFICGDAKCVIDRILIFWFDVEIIV